MTQIWHRAYGYSRGSTTSVIHDRPAVHHLSDGGVRLELTGRDAVWSIDLTRDECEQIAEAIGRGASRAWPWGPTDDD